jgi:hypothetical protein
MWCGVSAVSQFSHSDTTNGHALVGPSYSSGDSMTVESCITFCDVHGMAYAGLENSVSVNFALKLFAGANKFLGLGGML